MRPASYYYLAHAWPSRRRRQTQPGAPARATSRGRHARARRHELFGRELPALARRVLATLSSTSQTAL
jgi:hypothetical protein